MTSRSALPRRAPATTAALLATLLPLAACGDGSGATTGSASPSSTTPSTTAPPTIAAPTTATPTAATPTGTGPTTLTVVVAGSTPVTWRLTCDPAGGNHPDPAAACAALAANGATALPPVPPDQMCTMIYGGPERATVQGTWRGTPVSATFKRTNGCEIARWTALAGLLPAAGS